MIPRHLRIATAIRYVALAGELAAWGCRESAGAAVVHRDCTALDDLVTSTILDLFLLPALYLRFGRLRDAAVADPAAPATASHV